MSKRLIIAGGGIGGMASALALSRAGFDVTVYERAPVFADIGAGMSLWPNATRVLKSLGVLDEVVEAGDTVSQFNLWRPDGRLIFSFPMAGFETPAVCVHRATLHRALRNGIPASCLRPNRTIGEFSQSSERVHVRFTDGSEDAAEGLIAADGIHSTVRAQLHGRSRPSYRGYCIWRGIAPVVPGWTTGHIGETWGAGCRFGILPIGQGRVCWYATRNSDQGRPDGAGGRKAEVYELFKDWHGIIPSLIESTDPNNVLRNDAQDRAPLGTWGRGAVTLLGDAAHPMTPNVGQGACMAIEDAACLAKCLLASGNVAQALRSYEALRAPRTAFVARQSRRIGAIGQWENPWMVRGRDLITRLVLSHSAESRLNAVYDHEV